MVSIDQLAVAVLNGDQLTARALAQQILDEGRLSSMPDPDPRLGERVAIMSAALAELLADYASLQPPEWTGQWGRMAVEVDLLPATGAPLRRLMTEEAPEPLKRRNILAPKGFLRAV